MPSRRDQISMTDAEVRAFLAEQMVMQCATVGPRGVPHLMPLWYVPEGTDLVAWTYAKSQKAKNLERDPRAPRSASRTASATTSCAASRSSATSSWSGNRSRSSATGLGSSSVMPVSSHPRSRMVAQQAQKRVGLRFVPARTVSWDHRKLGGTY